MLFNCFWPIETPRISANVAKPHFIEIRKKQKEKRVFCYRIKSIYAHMLGFTIYTRIRKLSLSQYFNQHSRNPSSSPNPR